MYPISNMRLRLYQFLLFSVKTDEVSALIGSSSKSFCFIEYPIRVEAEFGVALARSKVHHSLPPHKNTVKSKYYVNKTTGQTTPTCSTYILLCISLSLSTLIKSKQSLFTYSLLLATLSATHSLTAIITHSRAPNAPTALYVYVLI
jgi:hypothetical protein